MNMTHFRYYILLLLAFMIGISSGYAETIIAEGTIEPSAVQTILSLQAPQADWTFSGTVTNESNERYHYFFQIRRNETRYHGMATVIDGQSKAVLVYEEASTVIEHAELTHWRVGNLFLRFNPINRSWVFGLKSKGKKGFNFKVDMLEQANTHLAKKQDLRHGIELLISQTGRLNGHLQADESTKEEFITAKKAWFRQIWVSKPQNESHPLTAVLCEFHDGSAFYSVTIPESDALRGSVAGWRDERGMPMAMSQFVRVEEAKDDVWQISISSPKASLSFLNLLAKYNTNHKIVIGVINQGSTPGFCAISSDDIDPGTIETSPS